MIPTEKELKKLIKRKIREQIKSGKIRKNKLLSLETLKKERNIPFITASYLFQKYMGKKGEKINWNILTIIKARFERTIMKPNNFHFGYSPFKLKNEPKLNFIPSFLLPLSPSKLNKLFDIKYYKRSTAKIVKFFTPSIGLFAIKDSYHSSIVYFILVKFEKPFIKVQFKDNRHRFIFYISKFVETKKDFYWKAAQRVLREDKALVDLILNNYSSNKLSDLAYLLNKDLILAQYKDSEINLTDKLMYSRWKDKIKKLFKHVGTKADIYLYRFEKDFDLNYYFTTENFDNYYKLRAKKLGYLSENSSYCKLFVFKKDGGIQIYD